MFEVPFVVALAVSLEVSLLVALAVVFAVTPVVALFVAFAVVAFVVFIVSLILLTDTFASACSLPVQPAKTNPKSIMASQVFFIL